MEIKKIVNKALNFSINRFIEIFGISIVIIGILLLISLVSFSSEDPNFIFPENTKIENILGYQGSFTADLFFQSVGLIALLIPFSFIFTGINIILNKKIFLIIESLFYTVLYLLFGSLFFSFFYSNSFKLYINDNGGFIGNHLEKTFLNSLISSNFQLFYYFLIIIILILFFFSIQFKIKIFYVFIKKLLKFLFIKKEKNYTNENEIINQFIPQEEIKSLIQEDLPFIKNETKNSNKIKFKLPSINLLKIPSKNEREKLKNEDYIDSKFLEKILLDFGVSGNIEKVSHGPVNLSLPQGLKYQKLLIFQMILLEILVHSLPELRLYQAEALSVLSCQIQLEKMFI